MILLSDLVAKVRELLKVPGTRAAFVNADAVSRARELLADTTAPYRWSDTQLTAFCGDGLTELAKIRSDVATSGASTEYTAAVANYIVYRALALDNDAQNNNGALSDKFFNLFTTLTSATPYYFTEAQITAYLKEASRQLATLRPELRIGDDGVMTDLYVEATATSPAGFSVPVRFGDALAFFAAYRGAVHSKNDLANYFVEQFNSAAMR